ncbi:glycosyltransferase [Nonomuraea gerenzanensis]|uniref:Glycosyl transferase, family 2 n=1 Tax=Nonomuraea gerenzanensis TaxID=93944 RepID=A0A1M4E1Z1_9ACTN|nr:glycosyltransferase [Nonomuraea gerenzanensis]UBU15114.1 glycosyltransferase [Nonomuraea gerenzanensis]SBO92857.1 glycosyl transferase, family 2 [Nonomuraea gerenzanensis]
MIERLLAELREARVFFAGMDDVPHLHARDGAVDLDRDLLEPHTEPERCRDVLVLAMTPADLRRIATLHKLLPHAERVVVAVLDTPASHPAPVPTPTPAHRWRALTDLRVHQPKNRVWVVDARFSAATPAGRTVTATARAFAGHRLDVIAAPAAAIAGVGAADWRPGDPNATPAEVGGPVPERVGAPGGDVVLRTLTADALDPAPGQDAPSAAGASLTASEPGRAPKPSEAGWALTAPETAWAGAGTPIERPALEAVSWEQLGRPGMAASPLADPDVLAEPSMIPPVDERLVNPQGFVTTPSRGLASLAERDGRWSVVLDGKVVTSFAESGGVTDADVARLRQIRGVEVDWRHAHSGPLAAVRVLAGLSAAGVPLVSGPVPRWAGALGGELVELLTRTPDLADDLRREEHSILLRRAALRTHGVAARWEQLGAPAPAPPLTSVLLATRRTDMVSFALGQIARQRGAELEVILALHGVPKGHPDVAAAIAAFEGPLTVYEADRRAVFGEVLNLAAARAAGSFLLKMDDDDWYGPDFLADLLLAHSYSGAQVVGTVPEFVYLSSIDVTVHRHQITEQITSFVAGGTILVERSAFQAVGGFRPLPRSVDTQFQEALQAAGGQIYRTHGLGYILRRGPAANHTWQEPIGTFLQRNRRQWRGFRPNALMALDGSPLP